MNNKLSATASVTIPTHTVVVPSTTTPPPMTTTIIENSSNNRLAVSSRKSSVSPTTLSQATIKTNYIETDDISGAAPEISDFIVETDLSKRGDSFHVKSRTRKSQKLIKKVLSMSEQVDEFIDQCIEIESNKKMFQQNVNWFMLTFKTQDFENMVSLFEHLITDTIELSQSFTINQFRMIPDMTFRSNLLCVTVIWIFMMLIYFIILPL